MDSKWRTWTVPLGIAAALLVGAAGQAIARPLEKALAPAAASRQLSHIEYDGVLEATFSAAIDADGNAVITMSASDLILQKVVSPTGVATLRLTKGKDAISFAINQNGYRVARGKRSASFNPAKPSDADRDAVRTLLLGSKAVRAFRELTAVLENRQGDDSVMVLATLLDGAMVHMLDGDPGAMDRIARRVASKRRTALQPAQYRPVQFQDCVLGYEFALLSSYDLYWMCLQTAENTPWYFYFMAKSMCEWEFLIRSQQYIYQFIACMAIPG